MANSRGIRDAPLEHDNEKEHRRRIARRANQGFPLDGIAPTNRNFGDYAGTGNYTITESDYLVNVTSGSPTITLPTAVGIQGREYCIKNSGTGSVTLDGDGSETIDGTATKIFSQYTSITVVSDGANWIVT